MQAYRRGTTNVLVFHNAAWLDAVPEDVWYVPDSSARLFSVKTDTQNSYSATFNEEEIVIRRSDGIVAGSGRHVNDLYVLAIRECIPQHTAEAYLSTQKEKVQVWQDDLGYEHTENVLK
jgi:hypothetical protein